MALGFSHSQMALSKSCGLLPCLSLPLPRFTAFPYSPWSVCSWPSGCGRMSVSCQTPGYLSMHDLWVPLPLCVLPGCPLISPSSHTHACTHHTLIAACSFFWLTSQNPHVHMEIDPPHPQQHHPAHNRQQGGSNRKAGCCSMSPVDGLTSSLRVIPSTSHLTIGKSVITPGLSLDI